MPSSWNRLTRPLRSLRWRLSRWSSASDQQFHDESFGQQQHDAFSWSYPGYLTIRRFADLAAAHFDGVGTVLDLGCGPGEITCELARRRPDIQFTGVDHSRVGLEHARANAARLGLANLRFVEGNLDAFVPDSPIDLVAMFDAFHHVLDPAAFVARLRPHVRRFFLIEPAGRWTGQWDRRHDLDWLPMTLWEIVHRIEHDFDLSAAAPDPSPSTLAPESHGEPTEHRYTLDDLQRFFDGYALDVRGTMAGLQQYGVHAARRSPLRDRLGEATYAFVAATEDTLRDRDLDLAAKHWAICAERGGTSTLRRVPNLPGTPPAASLMPAYGLHVHSHAGPTDARAGERFQLTLTIENTGWMPWTSAPPNPLQLSYHWLDARGRTAVFDGVRTPLARPAAQGESIDTVLQIDAPATAGTYILAVDPVHEGVTWFSEQGVPPYRIQFTVR